MSARMGRPTIFGKFGAKSKRYQGAVTPGGEVAFEAARRRLAALVSWPVTQVGDGDVFEYLARGDKETRRLLKGS